MKIQIIYSSLSGRTEKLSNAIYNSLNLNDGDTKSIHNLKDGAPVLDGDVILLGYWIDKGMPNKEMQEFMATIEGKIVGVYCTLGFYADSSHANDSIRYGINLVKDKNTVMGSYVCNGALSEKIIQVFRNSKMSGPHSATPENEIRWEIMKDHPTDAECNLASERFNERIELLRKFQKQNLKFTSIL